MRGTAHYGETPDFFSSDLISDISRAYHRQGLKAVKLGLSKEAEYYFLKSEALDPSFIQPTINLGYQSFEKKDYETALTRFEQAVRHQSKNLLLTGEFKSQASVVSLVKKDLSEALVYLGATQEKLGKVGDAQLSYRKAIETYPNPMAHYNLAVTYWGKDWNEVKNELAAALEIDPNMPMAQNYLMQAELQTGAQMRPRQ